MHFLKSFINNNLFSNYIKNHFVSPHIFLDQNTKSLDYEEKYTPVEYISSTSSGGQYIDLGCKLMENTDDIKIDIKFNIKGGGKDGSGKQSTLIAAQPEISPYPGFTLRVQSTTSDRIELCTKWAFTNSTKQSGATRYDSKYLSYTNGSSWVERAWGNIYEFSETLDSIPASQLNNFNCHLFCALDGSNNPFRFVEADLYYLRFTKGNIIVRDLIPVIKKGIPGLYDKYNRVFYKSQGNEEFIAGPRL